VITEKLERAPHSPCLSNRQAAFTLALLDPQRSVPRDLIGPDGSDVYSRFGVYRNNVVAGLVMTLQDAFPVVNRLVGERFFKAMAKAYVVNEPPRSPMMYDYGASFADFIKGFEPCAELPFLADVARIERAWVEAYHAAEGEPLGPVAFASVKTDDLPNLRIMLHPSLRLVHSSFPVLSIWEMNVAGGVLKQVDLTTQAQNILVARPHEEVELRSVPRGAAAFVRGLLNGLALQESFELAVCADARFDLALTLSGLMEAQVFVAFVVAGND
jgi:hypothetical protein